MAATKSITNQVLEVLQRNSDCEFDLLVKNCSEFTWNQLFYEVDRLNRSGQLCISSVGEGHYFLRLPKQEQFPQAEAGFFTNALSRSVPPAGADESES